MNPYRTAAEGMTRLVEEVLREQLPEPTPKVALYLSNVERAVEHRYAEVFEEGIEIHVRDALDYPGIDFYAIARPDVGSPRVISRLRIPVYELRFRDDVELLRRMDAFVERVKGMLANDPLYSPWPFRRAHGWPEPT